MSRPQEAFNQEHWRELWTTEGADIWQQEGVYKFLLKHKDLILAGKKDARVFIPLCGKAHELKWFLDLGHSVVGVEFVEECVRAYFSDNGLQMEEAMCPVTKCKILQTPDQRLRIFICNIFDFRRECTGLFDIVWDRSGFTAVKEEDRAKYASVLKSLLAPGFSYGMWTIVYDAPWYKRKFLCPHGVQMKPRCGSTSGMSRRLPRLTATLRRKRYFSTDPGRPNSTSGLCRHNQLKLS
ncbi:thiopurine S-methyltransferase-like isoform X1 [Haemaphysalis longicornis]